MHETVSKEVLLLAVCTGLAIRTKLYLSVARLYLLSARSIMSKLLGHVPVFGVGEQPYRS